MKATTLICALGIAGVLCMPASLAAQTAVAGDAPIAGGLPATIPIFPLESPTLFPNASYPFRIFEPRYRAMVADALKGDRIIGMVMLQPGYEAEYEGRPPIVSIGCAGLITDYEELPDGQYTIVLGGLTKFRVTGEDDSRTYRLAHVEAVPEVENEQDTIALGEQRQRLESLLLALSGRLRIPEPPAGVPDEQVVDELSQRLPIDPVSKQRLLEQDGPLARAIVLTEILEALSKAP
jgi:Lon protease-like protein